MSDFLHSVGMIVTMADVCPQVTGAQTRTHFVIFLPRLGEEANPVSSLSNGDNDALLQHVIKFLLHQGHIAIRHHHWAWTTRDASLHI